MKKLIYIAIVFSSLTLPIKAFAQESIDTQDFKYLVCSYIQDSETIESAVDKIDLVAEELSLDSSQEATIQQIYDGDLSPDSYCTGLDF